MGTHGPLIAAITDMQWSAGVYGSVGEIGVYFGMFSSVLALNTDFDSGERFFAVDVFTHKTKLSEFQGRYDKYVTAMRMWGLTPDGKPNPKKKLYIWHDSSVFISKTLFLTWNIPAVRLLSIDGCHAHPVVLSDFIKAICIMREGGILVFDDAIIPEWPGVTKAINDFYNLFNDDAPFKPLLICRNKLYICTSKFYRLYFKYVKDKLAKKFQLTEKVDKYFLKGGHKYFAK